VSTTVLIATDADEVYDEVDAALGGPDTTVARVAAGSDVQAAVEQLHPDLVVLDLQIGNMGGMAACLNLRLEEGADRLDPQRILMLLDRSADVFLAKRSGADGWLIKPIDALRLRRAADAVLAGGSFTETAFVEPPAATAPGEDDVEAEEPAAS
jgi:DNA-binding response OmpR family regulator